MIQPSLDLINSLKTTQEVDSFSSEIDLLTSALFRSATLSLEKALTSISSSSAKKITEIFLKNNLDMNDRKQVADFLDALRDLVKKFKVIKLILAFDPTKKTVENIHEFVSENIGAGYLLDIEVDENILAGAIVIFNGKYHDFSLRKAMEDAFANKREEMLKLMQQFPISK